MSIARRTISTSSATITFVTFRKQWKATCSALPIIIECDEKRFHYWQEIIRGEGLLVAESNHLFTSTCPSKVSAFLPEIYERILAIYEAQKDRRCRRTWPPNSGAA